MIVQLLEISLINFHFLLMQLFLACMQRKLFWLSLPTLLQWGFFLFWGGFGFFFFLQMCRPFELSSSQHIPKAYHLNGGVAGRGIV